MTAVGEPLNVARTVRWRANGRPARQYDRAAAVAPRLHLFTPVAAEFA